MKNSENSLNYKNEWFQKKTNLHGNRIFMLMRLSLLNPQFTNLCKFSCLKFAVLKFAVKSAIYKPM